MLTKFSFIFLPVLLLCAYASGQSIQAGRVFDATNGKPIPFATIKFGNNAQGIVAGLDGRFELPAGKIDQLEISSLGYESKKVNLQAASLSISLFPADNSLDEVTITPPYDKIRRILNNAIEKKKENNPDRYDWYRCNVYYKMIVDMDKQSITPDTTRTAKKKTSNTAKKSSTNTSSDSASRAWFNDFLKNDHLLMSETYSKRTWRRPQQLQEEVIASRFSGFKRSMFTSLVTDILPFHAYTDYITLNGKDYHNPVSRGYEQYYKLNLADEVVQGADTLWIISFTPRGHNANELKGTVFINSDGYAISQIIATAKDTMLKRDVRIEQQYEQLLVTDNEKRWFPKHLNYIIDWTQPSNKSMLTFHMKGYSRIDSVSWNEDPAFRFDKTHTVQLQPQADALSDSAWQRLRPEPLDAKEIRSYKVVDSLGDKVHLDKLMTYYSKLPEGKISIGKLDFDIARLFSWNKYERTRLGLGAQTNERLIKWLSVGGWGGYGFGDLRWKYGAFAEIYADKYREFVIRWAYSNDINDPGRIRMNNELDKNYLNSYLLQRVDNTKTYSISVKKKFGYLGAELTGRRQLITPLYQYALLGHGIDHGTFNADEGTLTLRYAYAERTAPFFGSYYSLGSKYPVWYAKLTYGNLTSNVDLQTPYLQAITAVAWHKHINRIGYEHILAEAGKSWSNEPLPLGKLFAGNGYNYNSTSALSIYTFGGIMTMLPYECYTDQFVSLIYRHDFDWKLYKVQIPATKFSSAPNICLQYNMLYGTLAHPEAQQYVYFTVPTHGYHEAGLLLNNLLRLRYGNVYYLTVNYGYFYHITPSFDASKNGRMVLGLGVEL